MQRTKKSAPSAGKVGKSTRFVGVSAISLKSAIMVALAVMIGLSGLTLGSTAWAITKASRIENKVAFYDVPESTSSVVYYAQDCSKQELFKTRPAPGAILPGEQNYDHTSHEVVVVWEDGTQVLKNAIVIHPDGSVTLPEMYHETPEEVEGWYQEWFPGTPYTRWDDDSQKWEIVYDGPFGMERIYPDYYTQPYVDGEGVVHTPGSDDYHPELEGMWGFVPPVLRPEGYEPGVPWPEPLDWSRLPELNARAEGTNWDSTVVFDRWVDGTKIYGNGLIVHPNGVYHTPADWVDVDEDGGERKLDVYFDETTGEWEPVYIYNFPPAELKPFYDSETDNGELAESPVAVEDAAELCEAVGDEAEPEVILISTQDIPITTGEEMSEPITTGESQSEAETLDATPEESVGDEASDDALSTTDEVLSGEAQAIEFD